MHKYNSLGGYLSVATSAARNDLIKSVILLNASPFWAFAPFNPDPTKQLFWNGVLPAPAWLLKFGSAYFDIMRNPKNVRRMLNTVYKIPAFDDELVDNIVASASGPGGHEAFTVRMFWIEGIANLIEHS
jgi:pimeloyl-ACP methyl ester carboxylesterase